MNSLLSQYQHICNLLNEFSVKLEACLLGVEPLSALSPQQLESPPSALTVLENQSIGCDEVLELIQLRITYSNIRNEAIYSISGNTEQPKNQLDEELLARFEALAKQNGVAEMKYVQVDKAINFAQRKYLFSGAFVMYVESEEGNCQSDDFFQSHRNQLKKLCHRAEAANSLAGFLRERGYAVFVEHGFDVVGCLNHTGQPSFQEDSAFRIPNKYRIVLYTSINSFV